MVSLYHAFNKRLQIIPDLMVTALALILTYYFKSGFTILWFKTDSPVSNQMLLLLVILLWGLFFNYYKDDLNYDKSLAEICFSLLKVNILSLLLLIFILYVAQAYRLNRTLVFIFLPLNYLLLIFEKRGIKFIVGNYFKNRESFYQQVYIIGTGERAQRFIERVKKNKEWRIIINGLIDKSEDLLGKEINGIKVVGSLKDIERLVRRKKIDELFFIAPRSWLVDLQNIFTVCENAGINFRLSLDLFDPLIGRIAVENSYDLPTLISTTVPDKKNQLFFKMIFDVIFSFLFLFFFSPVFMLIAISIKVTSPGPILFRHTRIGLNGRQFILYKFRSMKEDAHEKQSRLVAYNEMTGGGLFKMDNDPRIIPFGKFLRKTSLDEIPQFYNVLKGDMSLVGPRALSTKLYQYEIWQRRRLSMKPGITCLWQVEKRRETAFDKWMELDLEYIDTWGLLLDFRILLKTMWVVLTGKGAR